MNFCNILAVLLISGNLNPVSVNDTTVSDSIVYNDMFFNIKEENPDELILIGYSGNDETLVIPETIDGYTVTAIDSEVFKDNQDIKNVTLPDTINYFGSEVFCGSSLVSINIPKSLIVIPEYSFYDCSELETVVFHEDIVLLDYMAFKKTDIEVPDYLYDRGARGIEESDISCQFYEDEWEYTVVCEDGDAYARINRYNDYYTKIVVPDKLHGAPVTEIDSLVFRNVNIIPKLKSISFPETIKEINFSFKDSSLEEITLPNIDTIKKSQFANCKNLKKVNINSTCESFIIEDNAFENCSIDSIPCPETCTSINIGDNAFAHTNISKVHFDCDSVIGSDAFTDCVKLSSVILNNSNVDSRAFRDCITLDTVIINGNSSLGEESFYDCQALENITVENINIPMENAVSECKNFMRINNQDIFDITTGDFRKELKDFAFKNFYGVDDVGFMNLYVKAQAEKIIAEITSENMTDVQKIKAVHDWVCNNTVYDDGLSGNKKNHNDASVLMNDSTVCEGYARIANILYDTAGIETYYISGVGHAWNVVKVGNNYFHVDTTWDDGDKISYDWFMKSDDEMRNSDEYHASWKTYIPTSLHNFQQGKTLPECSYSMGDINQDNSINVADLVVMNKYILHSGNDYDSYVLADLTFDGVVDSFDLVRMRQMLVEQSDNYN